MPTPLEPHRAHDRTQKLPLPVAANGFGWSPAGDPLESTPLPPRSEPSFPRVRGYEVLAVIGSGGMGIVYGARHRQLNRRVAIKTLRGEALADPAFRDRFRAEAQAIARLQHPNIIQVFEVGTVEPLPFESHPSPFLALELVEGGSLADRTGSPQPPRLAARIVETLARAAHAAHQLGVVHRDLKPANVLLTPEGEPKVADFGIAKQLGSEPGGEPGLTRAGFVVGTPEYMAPEQFAGFQPTPAIDIYALGVILYELLTARVPFQGAAFADTMRLTLNQEPVPPRSLQPGVPRDLETICLKCLEKAPGKRYASAEALADDLARWAAGRAIRAKAVGPLGRTARWVKRNPAIAGLSLAVYLVAMAGLLGIVWGWDEARKNAARALANADVATQAERDARAAADNERAGHYRYSVLAASGALRLHDTEAARHALDDAAEAQRDWVWRLLRAQLDRSSAVLRGHGEGIRNFHLSNDGRWALLHCWNGPKDVYRVWDIDRGQEYGPLDFGSPTFVVLSNTGVLAYATRDNIVHLRELATGHQLADLRGHTERVYDISFSADGRCVFTTAGNGTLSTWDVATGQHLHQFQAPADAGCPLVVSPDGRTIAARGMEGVPARVWDRETGREIIVLEGEEDFGLFVRYSPKGDRLVSVERFPHNDVHLWDIATGKRVATFTGHQNQVRHVAFSPDGTRMLTTSMDRTIRVWNLSDRPESGPVEAVLVLKGHTGQVNYAAFSPDSARILSAAQDRTVRYWNARTGEELAVLCGHTDQVIGGAFRPNGRELVSASWDGTLRLWDAAGAEDGYAVRRHQGFVYHVAWFPDGEWVLSTAWDGSACVWSATTGREVMRLDHGADLYVVAGAVHPAGRYLATLARHQHCPGTTVRLWDAATGSVIGRWIVPAGWQDSRIAFSPTGDRFAAGSVDGAVHVWDTNSRKEVAVLKGSDLPVRDVAFTRDGKWLAAASDDGDCSIRVWDVDARRMVRELHGHKQGVHAVAWDLTGTRLASGSNDRTARVWDVATGESQELPLGTEVYGVAFSAEGNLLGCACADHLVRLWDVKTCQELAQLSGHKSYVHHLAFSPDGTRLVTASGDHTLRVWGTLPRAERERK